MKQKGDAKASMKRVQALEAARSLFLVRDFFSISMDEIADSAHLSKRTLYQMYDNRDALTAAAVTHDFENWQEWFFDAIREHATTTADSLTAFHEVLRLWMEDPDFHGCLFARVILAPHPFPEAVRAAAAPCAARLYEFFREQARKSGMSGSDAFARMQLVCLLLLLGDATRELGADFRTHLAQDARSFTERER